MMVAWSTIVVVGMERCMTWSESGQAMREKLRNKQKRVIRTDSCLGHTKIVVVSWERVRDK